MALSLKTDFERLYQHGFLTSLSLSLSLSLSVCVCVFFFLWLPGTGSDLEATWDSIMKNLDQTAPLFSLAGVHGTGAERAGGWNDPDM